VTGTRRIRTQQARPGAPIETRCSSAIEALDELDVYPSRNQLRKNLPPRCRLIDDDVAELWRTTVMALGWPDPATLRR